MNVFRVMISRVGRRGFFERPPRALYRRTGARYFGVCAVIIVLNGVVVAVFGVVAVLLYVQLSTWQVAWFAACLAVAFAGEGALAAVYFLRAAEPAGTWLACQRPGDDALAAWSAAAGLPLSLVRRPSLYALGAVGAAAADVLLAVLLQLPVYQAALLFPLSYLLYISSSVLRYVGLELSLRPVLRDIGESMSGSSLSGCARV